MGVKVAAAILLSVAGIAAFSILPVMIGAIADARGLSASEAGYVAAADLCGFALAAVAAVFWVGRINARLAAGLGLIAALAGNLLSLHAAGFDVLLGARALAGVGAGTAYAVAMSTLSRSARAERDFGIMVAAQILYQVVALLVLPRWVTAWGTEAVFLSLAGTVMVAFVALVPEPPVAAATQGRRVTARSRPGWRALAAVALFSVNLGALWTYIERIGVQTSLTPSRTGTILAVALALSVLGALAASAVGSSAGWRRPFIVAVLAQLLALALLTEASGVSGFTAGAVLYSLAWAFAVPLLYAMVAGTDPSGRLIVLAPAAQAIGTGLGPALAGSLLGGASYLAVNGLAAAALVLAMICMPRGRRALQPAPDIRI